MMCCPGCKQYPCTCCESCAELEGKVERLTEALERITRGCQVDGNIALKALEDIAP